MRRVRRFQLAQYKCLVIKYAKDTRYSDTGMATHDKYVLSNCFQLMSTGTISDAFSFLGSANYLCNLPVL